MREYYIKKIVLDIAEWISKWFWKKVFLKQTQKKKQLFQHNVWLELLQWTTMDEKTIIKIK